MKCSGSPLFETLREVPAGNPAHGPWNMAVDEALLHSNESPVFRFYSWGEPQITFGFFGDLKTVTRMHPGLRLTRRWTGGGIVEHGEDFTWSLCVPAGDPVFSLRGGEVYRLLHQSLAEALAEVGVVSASAQQGRAGVSCFSSPVHHDLIDSSGKIAGGALRKTRKGILYQGSVLVAPDLHADLAKCLISRLGLFSLKEDLSPSEYTMACRLEQLRYASIEWLAGRGEAEKIDL